MAKRTVMRFAVCLPLFMTVGCGNGSEPTAAPSPRVSGNGHAGRWSGTVLVSADIPPGSGPPTTQSQPLSFIVSGDERVTDISIGYNISGCSGTKTFSGLTIVIGAAPINLELLGPSPINLQLQGWVYASPTADGKNQTHVSGTFTSDVTALGSAEFVKLLECGGGSGFGTWLAFKQ